SPVVASSSIVRIVERSWQHCAVNYRVSTF
ncbi:MAG: hypothetical protein ACI8XC_001587, partial [Gammaproteobacteria bacterium]